MQVPLSADLQAAVAALREEVAGDRDATVDRHRARRHRDRDDSRAAADEDAAQRARERPARARARPPACIGRLGMTPPPPPRGRRPRDRPAAAARARSRGSATAAAASGGRSRASAGAAASSCSPLFVVVPARVARRRDDRRHRGVRLELRPRRAAPGRRRRELVRLRRRRLRARRDPGGAQPHAGPAPRDLAVGSEGDRRDRGPALLSARRRRPGRHHARGRRRRTRGQDRAGRLDDHAGARAQPLPLARADVQAQAHRGVPRDQAVEPLVEGQDPDRVHEPGVLRQPRVRNRGGRRDVLLESGEET